MLQLGEMGAIVRIHAYLEKEGIINVNATEPSRSGATAACTRKYRALLPAGY